MALRPPEPRRKKRRAPGSSRVPDIGLVAIFVTPVLLLGLRFCMAAIGIATWTVAYRIVELSTVPFVWPFDRLTGLQTAILNAATVSELFAFIVATGIAFYVLATMTVRYER